MRTVEPIKVVVVDDHTVVRRGLAAILMMYEDLTLAGEASNGIDAIRLTGQVLPDVILMDLIMPEMDGATATRTIRQRWPQIQVVVLTNFEDSELVKQALQAGAISYLLKNVTAQDLAKAIRAAHAGHSVMAPEATRVLVRAARQMSPPGHDLTPREWEVLHLMTDGYSNPEIARKLSVSRSTARAHVSQILSKLGVTNRAEAIAVAFRSNLVT